MDEVGVEGVVCGDGEEFGAEFVSIVEDCLFFDPLADPDDIGTVLVVLGPMVDMSGGEKGGHLV